MLPTPVTLPQWRKSSYSAHQSNCVEVAISGTDVVIQDTKDNGAGPTISFTPEQWTAFLAETTAGVLPVTNGAVTVGNDGEDWLVRAVDGGTTLRFTPAEWQAFRNGAADREFDVGTRSAT